MGWRVAEFWCDPCAWRGESLEQAPVPASMPCQICGGDAEHVISAPKVKTVWATVTRGKNSKDDRPPRALDTEALADGMKMSDWRAMRKKLHSDRRRAQVRRMLG